MITPAQITRRADADGVSAQTVERDYALAHMLAALTRLDEQRLVFKGGTALRYCYLDECRYSADLDFSLVGIGKPQALGLVERVLNDAKAEIGFEMFELDERTPPRIRFVGPLGRERSIKLDLADDELIIETRQARLLPRWPDLEMKHDLTVYSESEIAGEKLRCVIQRLQCRDLFDLHAMFEILAVDPSEAALRFEAKARHRGIDPALFEARYRARLTEYERRWQEELGEHLADVPQFDGIERRVTRSLREGRLVS
ncbi:MAG: nucleotidyl transferase AbiEii/AbiGii toxin family protein [Acidimicrobiia bacterium]